MALELKGLKTNIRNLASRVDRLNQMAVKADERGAHLEGHLTDIEKQFADHVDDIEFAANVLGNSAGQSGESQKPVEAPKPLPATQPAATHFNPPAAIIEHPRAIPRITLSPDDAAKISPQEVGQAAAVTFQPADPLQAR